MGCVDPTPGYDDRLKVVITAPQYLYDSKKMLEDRTCWIIFTRNRSQWMGVTFLGQQKDAKQGVPLTAHTYTYVHIRTHKYTYVHIVLSTRQALHFFRRQRSRVWLTSPTPYANTPNEIITSLEDHLCARICPTEMLFMYSVTCSFLE